MSSPTDVFRLGILAVCVNVALMLVKIGAGVVGNSYALVADGIESASDIFTSLITWAGFRISLKPEDDNHPYGHGKVEALAGIFSGLSLWAAAGFIAWHSVLEIRTPHHAPAWFTLPVLLAVAGIKEGLARKVARAGDDLGSTALKGDAWHHRSDAVTSAAAAVGIAVALIGGAGYEAADDWAALIACGIIVVNGGLILRVALHDLLDGNVTPDVVEKIHTLAIAVDAVENTEKCRVRKSGIHLFVEIHIRVDAEMTVREGHRISHEVKDRLMEGDLRIRDVIVHVEPAA